MGVERYVIELHQVHVNSKGDRKIMLLRRPITGILKDSEMDKVGRNFHIHMEVI